MCGVGFHLRARCALRNGNLVPYISCFLRTVCVLWFLRRLLSWCFMPAVGFHLRAWTALRNENLVADISHTVEESGNRKILRILLLLSVSWARVPPLAGLSAPLRSAKNAGYAEHLSPPTSQKVAV